MNITKKPYEISLWDEQLVWHRRKLKQVEVEKENYCRGVYYVVSDSLGATSYELSYGDYTPYEEGKSPYFQLEPLDKDKMNWLEGNSSDSVDITNNSNWYDENGKMIPNIVYSFYKEVRLCTIGSDTMDSPARAVNGKLVRKVNGEVTFTFTMYYRYYDTQVGQLEYNPYIRYLTNERKIKLKYDGEWYDLIIKQVQENSDSKAFTYTCKDQFVNELSKTGFELEFDNELENNMGTIEYLAEQILEGSDWQLEGNSDLKQFIEEPLYRITLGQNISAKEMGEKETGKDITIQAGQKIYAFYSQINDKKDEVQFLFANTEVDENGDNKFVVNDDLVIDKEEHSNYVINNVTYDEKGWPTFVKYNEKAGSDPIALAEISTKYRGMRLVRQVRTIYDAKIDKYVQEYKKQQIDEDGDPKCDEDGKPIYDEVTYYGFEETKYLSPNAVNNYVVNPNAFTNTTGWYVQPNAEGAKTTLELVSDPPFNAGNIGNESINFTSYLKFTNNGGALINSSINSYKSSLEGFIAGETTYVLRLKCKEFDEENKIGGIITPTAIKIQQYKNMDEFEIEGDAIFEFLPWEKGEPTNGQEPDPPFVYYKAVCNRTITQADLQNWDKYYGLFLTFDSQYEKICIEDIQMFLYVLDGDKLCVPGGELFAKIETTKKYYDPTQTYSSLEEVQFEPAGGIYVRKYAEGAEAYTKVSSITAKESNRFNLLQDLNEKFECWARFRVEHNPDTGEILYGKDKKWYDEEGNEIECPTEEAYRQQKFISFHEYAGEHNYVGFKYGINSKSIQRTLDSNAIVSKMIVKDNANEFARNGFCSIARATDNSSKENFVLNFDHYYRHCLLDLDVVTSDLYVDSNGYLGYYKKLKEINQNRDGLIDKQANLLKEIANYEAQYQTYKTSHDSALEERNQMEDNIFLLIVPKEKREEASKYTFPEIISAFSEGWEDDSSYIKYTTSWMQCDNVIKQHSLLYQKADEHLNGIKNENGDIVTKGVKTQYEDATKELNEITKQKRALNLSFYKKYSRFIQEGSWINEDYVDDNLYYLDSLSTLHTSAQPKVTYNISVVDVSPLPGYEAYNFNLGDITYVEDREFFGYSLIDGTTPYREEVVVNEITTELDAPEKNSIKVQNYKTQFEDLFQRITAQTQQAEYHTGEYNRAASIVEQDGSISVSTLENSFANNSFKLSNARDQSVVIDESGITSTSLANPNEMVRIVNGGIFMSTDGGLSWKTGLTGYGLNSSYLTTGQINTEEIHIMNGNNAAFRWDAIGLSAYGKQDNGSYNKTSFVRFDQHGIYGIKDANDEWVPTSVDEVHEDANFALTWNGFSLKTKHGKGSVGVSSTNDFYVNDGVYDRIKIGYLGKQTRYSEFVGNTFENGINYYVLEDGKYKETSDTEPQKGVIYYSKEDIDCFGLRIGNNSGDPVMETDDQGDLWLKNRLLISDTVSLGNLDGNVFDAKGRVFDANGKFIIYNDGTFKAEEAELSGKITADKGRIGGLTIDGHDLIAESDFCIKIGAKEVLKIDNETLLLSGKIEANGGTIGGFVISENSLVSTETGADKGEPSLKLIGNEGKIIANNIVLGISATIANYLKIGEAYIYNPEEHRDSNNENRLFIQAGQTTIYDNGRIEAGDIMIDGKDSKIYGKNFSITPDQASFSNVRVSGEIETVVFKKNAVQAAGGAMIFRPSYKAKAKTETNFSELELLLEENEEVPKMVGHHVWIVDSRGKYFDSKIDSQDAKTLLVKYPSNKVPQGDISFIIDLGIKKGFYITLDEQVDVNKNYYFLQDNEYKEVDYKTTDLPELSNPSFAVDADGNPVLNKNSCEFVDGHYGWNLQNKYEYLSPEPLIGINGGKTKIDDLIYPCGLTITELDAERPHLYIGDLTELNNKDQDFEFNGHGLYSDNVYLNGSLVTKSFGGTYAGINTLSGVSANKNLLGTDRNIIFWAGAKTNSNEDIREAPFQVTEDGYIYVKNSIFAGGSITGSDIYAARIHGIEDKDGAALSIYDAEKGIGFYKVDPTNKDEIEVFTIGSTGLKIGEHNFIFINSEQAIFKTKGSTNYLSLQEISGIPALYHHYSNTNQCGLFFEEDKTSFKFISIKEEEKIETVSSLEILQDLISFKQSVELSSGDTNMQYKAVNGGYDLYIVAALDEQKEE